MATRQQVLSLFGATPEQVMETQRRQQAEFMAAQRDGFSQAGGAIGLGLARLFGGPSSEMQMAERMQQAIAGVDPNDPKALRTLAQSVSQFAPERALQIAAYAGELEKSQIPSTVDIPTIVGYETEPDIDATTGLQRLDENKQPLFKQTPIFRNVPFERTRDGLKSLVPGYSLPSGASTAVKTDDAVEKPQAQVPDYITNEQGVVVPNPAKTAEASAEAVSQDSAAVTAQPTTTQGKGRTITEEERQRLEANTSGPGVAPREMETTEAVPSIARALPKGTPIYGDPEELSRARKAITQQIVALEKSKDKNKNAKLKILRERRKEIDKLRIASRRKGPPKDLQITGKDSDVLSGFGNVR